MKTRHYGQTLLLLTLMFTLFMTAGAAQQAGTAKKKEFGFHGKIEKVDLKAKTLQVKNDTVKDWMGPGKPMDSMSMTYSVDKPEVLSTLKAGDEINAKVYEGDYKVLYSVKVVPAKPAAEAPKKK
jgi:Cu/Ag efflux protein CusF